MNKRYEEGRKPFFSNSGEKLRKQYVWGEDEKGNKKLIETEPIDIQAEIESYADECDIKNIVRKASFDPEFAKSLADSAKMEEIEVIDQRVKDLVEVDECVIENRIFRRAHSDDCCCVYAESVVWKNFVYVERNQLACIKSCENVLVSIEACSADVS